MIIWQGLLSAAFAASLSAIFAVWVYRRQKQQDLDIERHLRAGIDLLLERTSALINSHTQNWALALNCVKLYRDVPHKAEEFLRQLRWIDPEFGTFPFAAVGRVNALINSVVLWKGLQIVSAFAARSHWLCTVEVGSPSRCTPLVSLVVRGWSWLTHFRLS